MLVIYTNSKLIDEKRYIIDVIFSEFLAVDYKLVMDDNCNGFLIRLCNGNNLVLNDNFWNESNERYLCASSLPNVFHIKNCYSPEEFLPVLYGVDYFESNTQEINCGVDIFGGCFFMLSRMEEAIYNDRDIHERFSAISSTAYKNGFLDRPIVDEYTEMLWNMLVALDPLIVRKDRQTELFVTCDVDWPFDPFRRSLTKTIRKSLSDIIRKRGIKSALACWKFYAFHRLGLNQHDDYRDTIDWMMDVNEKEGNQVSFYFITEYTSEIDSDFDFDSDEMRILFRNISSRGHYIGLHPGYRCFDDSQRFKKSSNTLLRVLKEEGIVQPVIGGRMHLLRWDILQTPQLWEENNFNYDSTLSFADVAGFRCGTCNEFSMYDLNLRKKMNLKQRPLINMECTLIAERYENLGYTECALQRFNYFKNICKKYNGKYTLLWHNSHFSEKEDRYFYQKIIKND